MSGHIGQARIGEKDEEIMPPERMSTPRRGYMAVASEHH
jgi:hypothetical protein